MAFNILKVETDQLLESGAADEAAAEDVIKGCREKITELDQEIANLAYKKRLYHQKVLETRQNFPAAERAASGEEFKEESKERQVDMYEYQRTTELQDSRIPAHLMPERSFVESEKQDLLESPDQTMPNKSILQTTPEPELDLN